MFVRVRLSLDAFGEEDGVIDCLEGTLVLLRLGGDLLEALHEAGEDAIASSWQFDG